MGSLISIMLIVLSLEFLVHALQGPESPRNLDLAIRRYAVESYGNRSRTGVSHSVNLPANLSRIVRAHTVRFRCGSLRRYGGRVKEFHLGVGLDVHPCVERVMIVTEQSKLPSMYTDAYDLTGYQLISPVLSLLAYKGDDLSNPIELEILATERNPVTIDFSNVTNVTKDREIVPFCVSFEGNGKVTLANQVRQNMCATRRKGHFGLVIESPEPAQFKKKVSKTKAATVISIGAVLGTALMALLLVAMLVKVKKKNRLEEMERRAYEEEALQVTMVGHVRAPTAPPTRTVPAIEHYYTPPFRPPP